MNRRGFLEACLIAAAAPAIVRADSLMRVVPRDTVIFGMDLARGVDEYEEGVWVPTVTGNLQADGHCVYTETAAYIRAGQIIRVQSRLEVPADVRHQWEQAVLTPRR